MKTAASFHPTKILCPIDFSDLSDLALKYAATGAQVFNASVVVFHARRFELPPYFTKSQIAELTRQHRADLARAREFLRVHVRTVLGAQANEISMEFDLADAHPVDAVLDAAKRHRSELIVMGTNGRGGAKRIWLGSVTENVVRQASVPLFVVRQRQHEFIDPTGPNNVPRLQTILCPVNLSQAARQGLEQAIALARMFNARLVTVCVLEPGDSRSLSEARQDLSAWLGQTDASGCALEVVTRKGRAGERIVSLAEETKADLIVLAAHHSSPPHTWRWGATTELVLRQARSPVLVIPE